MDLAHRSNALPHRSEEISPDSPPACPQPGGSRRHPSGICFANINVAVKDAEPSRSTTTVLGDTYIRAQPDRSTPTQEADRQLAISARPSKEENGSCGALFGTFSYNPEQDLVHKNIWGKL
ncbi:MAG: hypothetical protein IPP80_12500 [Ignavibacteria bacterium]|nr:hypothetical protein [Ignavibacteria bacterium]